MSTGSVKILQKVLKTGEVAALAFNYTIFSLNENSHTTGCIIPIIHSSATTEHPLCAPTMALGAIKRIKNSIFDFRKFMVLGKQVDSTYIFFTFKTITKIAGSCLAADIWHHGSNLAKSIAH